MAANRPHRIFSEPDGSSSTLAAVADASTEVAVGGWLSFHQSRNPGGGRQRFDSGEPLHQGVEEEAHTEGQSRV